MKAASYRSVARQQRGTAILLVVAVLVLLAVIGMVYVVSSRAEKMNARSNQEAAGLDLARDALLTTVRTALFDYTIDKTDGTAGMPGQIGGLSGVAASPTFNQLAARRYDYPHDNSPSSTGNLANATNGLTTSYFKDEALLGDGIASRGLWNKNASYVVGDRVSYGTSNSAIRGYVAITTSTNAIPSTATANWAPCGNSASRIDPTYPWFSNFNGNPTSTPVVPPGALNVIDPTMIDPATIINANVNPLGMILDGPVQVLPVHSGSNVQYRYALRVIDTNRMLNINTGSPFQPVKTSSTTAQTLLPYGNYLSSIWIGRPRSGNDPISSVANNGPLNDSDTGSVSALQDYNTAPFGRGGGASGLTLGGSTEALVTQWEKQILSIEKPSNTNLMFFDLADELELRSYGNRGDGYPLRPGLTGMWSNTFQPGVNTPGILFNDPGRCREKYTTYSFDRDLRAMPDPAAPYTLTAVSTITPPGTPTGLTAVSNVWSTIPTPACVNANPRWNTSDDSSWKAYKTASAATQIAQAMEWAGYTASPPSPAYVPASYGVIEPRAFAANYLTYRYPPGRVIQLNGANVYSTYGGTGLTNNGGPTTPGISFIDDQGICIRGAKSSGSDPSPINFSNSGDLHAAAGTVIVGYTAQPYINEMSAMILYSNSASITDATTSLVSLAIELNNPHGMALDLTGWKLLFFSTVSGSASIGSIDLGSSTVFPNGIGANGANQYAVIKNDTTAAFNPAISGSLVVTSAAIPLNKSGIVVLTRPYLDRNGALADAVVDSFTYDFTYSTRLNKPATVVTGTSYLYSLQRDNTSQWTCTVDITAQNQTTPSKLNAVISPNTNNLGFANTPYTNPAVAATKSVRLYDRWTDISDYPQTLTPPALLSIDTPFYNISDFNRIMRIANCMPNAPITATNYYPMATQLRTIDATAVASLPAQIKSTDLPYEAMLHFDFKAAPGFFETNSPTTAGDNNGDPRAIKLLENLTFLDRVSDPTIDIGGGYSDINKIRLPGRINVNTAPGEVLRCLPNMTQYTGSDQSNKIVSAILGYRDRLNLSTAISPLPSPWNNYATTLNYINTTYKGLGFRTKGELIKPIYDASFTSAATSLDGRDQVWASMFNLMTVRSDTFVVYGYIEAVMRHPRAGSSSNLQLDTSTATDDPNAQPTSTYINFLLRTGRKRFVAIIDRSWCNYPRSDTVHFTLPKVVAYKELPY